MIPKAELSQSKVTNVTSGFVNAFDLVKPQMSALDVLIKAQLPCFEPEIRDMVEFCLDTSGKRIRPALVFFSGWSGVGVISNDLVRAAAVVELIHLATLVHDDIMDGAVLRRGRSTAVKIHGPTASVLVGDALFAHALNLATQFSTTEVCAVVSDSMRKVCAGEIIQTARRASNLVSKQDYERVIQLKTGELFRVSCQLGAMLNGLNPDIVKAFAQFGDHLGIAYQIYDDLVDFFGDEKKIGKTLGTDLVSGKMTLPLFALKECLPPEERTVLEQEICGQKSHQIELRLKQMKDYGIYDIVVKSIDSEIELARSGLLKYQDSISAVSLLLGLTDVLKHQVDSLRS
jgi:octaprenyl-diphosphate synthase